MPHQVDHKRAEGRPRQGPHRPEAQVPRHRRGKLEEDWSQDRLIGPIGHHWPPVGSSSPDPGNRFDSTRFVPAFQRHRCPANPGRRDDAQPTEVVTFVPGTDFLHHGRRNPPRRDQNDQSTIAGSNFDENGSGYPFSKPSKVVAGAFAGFEGPDRRVFPLDHGRGGLPSRTRIGLEILALMAQTEAVFTSGRATRPPSKPAEGRCRGF